MNPRIVTVTLTASDGWFTARCDAIPGAISEGRSVRRALEMLADAIRELDRDLYAPRGDGPTPEEQQS